MSSNIFFSISLWTLSKLITQNSAHWLNIGKYQWMWLSTALSRQSACYRLTLGEKPFTKFIFCFAIGLHKLITLLAVDHSEISGIPNDILFCTKAQLLVQSHRINLCGLCQWIHNTTSIRISPVDDCLIFILGILIPRKSVYWSSTMIVWYMAMNLSKQWTSPSKATPPQNLSNTY